MAATTVDRQAIPTRAQLVSVPGDLDQEAAWRRFGGKSAAEARALFADDALNLCEDLMHMGAEAFCFYVLSLIDYLQSAAATDDEEALAGFVSVCELRFRFDAEEIAPVHGMLHDTLRELRPRAERFTEWYGDLAARIDRLLG